MRLLPFLTAVSLVMLSSATRADFESLTQTDFGGAMNSALRSLPRTYQAYYAPPEFTSLTTTQSITGLQFRLSTGSGSGVTAGSSWPSQNLTFSDYTIQLSIANPDLVAQGQYSSSTTAFSFAKGPNLTTVRSGPLTIPAGSYTADADAGQVNDYGLTIEFSTPYTFQPGDSLVLSFSHSGFSQTEPTAFFAAGIPTEGQGDAILSTASANAAVSSADSVPLFVNFISTPVPEPQNMSLLITTALGLASARRCRK